MINIIEYKLEFTYEIEDIYEWCDDFKLLEKWEILQIQKCRKIRKMYMERSPYIKPKNKYEVALYTKNKWIYLNNGFGETTGLTKSIEIQNLKISTIKAIPIISIYKMKFDLQIMLIICEKMEETMIIENRKISTKSSKILHKDIAIKLYDNILIYKGEKVDEFEIFCNKIKERYEIEKEKYEDLFKLCDKHETDLYMSLAYKTWFRAKRLNQKEWPCISETAKENSIKFGNAWYYHPIYKVGLAERKDDNDEMYIPKIYKEIKSDNGIPKLPYSVKNGDFKNTKFIKWWEGESCTIVNYKGEIIETDLEPEYIVYEDKIIGKTDKKYKKEGKVQILDKKGKVSMIINEIDEIKQYNEVKIRNMKTVPWNYKHIIHDYNKLGRLVEGDYTDLMHIGIVKEKGKDIISWPKIDNLYVGKAIETKRLITLKNQDNVEIITI